MDKIKVLYVEDELFLAKIVKESLEIRDFEVNHVADGADVIANLKKITPDICILDVMLPNVDGFTLATQIRKVLPALPIIFLSAKDQTIDVLKGFEVGGNDYLKKPFSMEELIVRLKNLLAITQKNQAQNNQKEEIQLGKYIFSTNKYELSFGDFQKKLSHREAQLLQYFYENRNSTIDRKQLLMTIWNDDSYFNSRNLDVYIRKMREYLNQDDNVEIITLKGVGYFFRID